MRTWKLAADEWNSSPTFSPLLLSKFDFTAISFRMTICLGRDVMREWTRNCEFQTLLSTWYFLMWLQRFVQIFDRHEEENAVFLLFLSLKKGLDAFDVENITSEIDKENIFSAPLVGIKKKNKKLKRRVRRIEIENEAETQLRSKIHKSIDRAQSV